MVGTSLHQKQQFVFRSLFRIVLLWECLSVTIGKPSKLT
jgi:hypothetical protein